MISAPVTSGLLLDYVVVSGSLLPQVWHFWLPFLKFRLCLPWFSLLVFELWAKHWFVRLHWLYSQSCRVILIRSVVLTICKLNTRQIKSHITWVRQLAPSWCLSPSSNPSRDCTTIQLCIIDRTLIPAIAHVLLIEVRLLSRCLLLSLRSLAASLVQADAEDSVTEEQDQHCEHTHHPRIFNHPVHPSFTVCSLIFLRFGAGNGSSLLIRGIRIGLIVRGFVRWLWRVWLFLVWWGVGLD